MMHAEDTGILKTILSGAYGAGVQDNLLQSLRHVLLMEEVSIHIACTHSLITRVAQNPFSKTYNIHYD